LAKNVTKPINLITGQAVIGNGRKAKALFSRLWFSKWVPDVSFLRAEAAPGRTKPKMKGPNGRKLFLLLLAISNSWDTLPM
jgi:hypothetical protein